jgi:hypothetical protein
MKVLESQTGILHAIVSSEGNTIMNGTPVVIKTIVADKDIEVHVISTRTTVRLPYYETDVEWLLGLK